jgi:hypothetical protein
MQSQSIPTHKHNTINSIVQLRLIYFWAYVEAGLAGLLHALHLPITGFVAGGLSIIVNVLLVHYSDGKMSLLCKALGIVLAIKFMLSPFTPVGAYVAVCFQGLSAICIFYFVTLNRWSIALFAILVMLESALQKPFLAYLFFGKQFLLSSIAMVKATFGISQTGAIERFYFLFFVYLMLYVLWALLIAFWTLSIRNKLEKKELTEQEITTIASFRCKTKIATSSFRHLKTPVIFVLSFAFLLLIFPFIVHQLTWFYALRLGLILLSVLFVFPYLIRKHQAFLFKKNEGFVHDMLTQLPLIKHRTALAWELSKNYVWYQRVRHFVFYAIWLNVFYETS